MYTTARWHTATTRRNKHPYGCDHHAATTAPRRFEGHTDYVRAAAVSPANSETWATGGYDHVVKLWDVRAGGGKRSGSACTLSLDHGAPVEDVAFFTSGVSLIS